MLKYLVCGSRTGAIRWSSRNIEAWLEMIKAGELVAFGLAGESRAFGTGVLMYVVILCRKEQEDSTILELSLPNLQDFRAIGGAGVDAQYRKQRRGR